MKSFLLWKGRFNRLKFFYSMLIAYLLLIEMPIAIQLYLKPYIMMHGSIELYRLALNFALVPIAFGFYLMLCAYIKRFHDINLSGWYSLVAIIPFVGQVVLVYLLFVTGTEGPNKYGPDPLKKDAIEVIA